VRNKRRVKQKFFKNKNIARRRVGAHETEPAKPVKLGCFILKRH
jgi:hypothetical protein